MTPPTPAPVIIGKATTEDAATMVAFVQRIFSEGCPFLPSGPGDFKVTVDEERELIKKCDAAGNSVFLIAKQDGEIVGMLNLFGGKRNTDRHAGTFGMSVRADRRGQGIGNALLLAMIAWAKETRLLRRIELGVYHDNAAAIHLYRKHGFTQEGIRRKAFLRGGEFIDDIQMALLL